MNLNYLKEKIKHELSVKTVAEHYLGSPKTANRYHCHITPTESRDNLAVYDDRWFCFYCNQGGDSIALVQTIFGMDYRSAIAKICEDFNIRDEHDYTNLSNEDRKKIFEYQKNKIIQNETKKRNLRIEKSITDKLISKIHRLSDTIANTEAIIRSTNSTSEQIDIAVSENLSSESELKRLTTMYSIMNNKTFEGDEWYIYPETTIEDKENRKNRLISDILYHKVEI